MSILDNQSRFNRTMNRLGVKADNTNKSASSYIEEIKEKKSIISNLESYKNEFDAKEFSYMMSQILNGNLKRKRTEESWKEYYVRIKPSHLQSEI